MTVHVSHAGDVATVTVDRPHKANALDSATMDAFAAALRTLSEDASLRAVIVTGAGTRSFIAGADVTEMATLGPATARAFITRVHHCCAAVRDCPAPVIARIGGACFGAGLELAAACDLRLAADHAIFGMPEVRLGIPSVVEAALLPLLVGWGRTRHMLLLGGTFPAADALAWGLLEQVVPVAELDAATAAWIDSLRQATPAALRAQKALIRRWEDLPLRAAIAAGIDAFADAYHTPEPAAAMQAFHPRRGPA